MSAFIRPDVFAAVTSLAAACRWSPEKVGRVMALARYAEARREAARPLPNREPHRVWVAALGKQVTR